MHQANKTCDTIDTLKASYKAILTSCIGGGLEHYDFLIFGFFAPIFSPLFFPVQNQLLTTVSGYIIFGIGFICRPLGGIIFGHIGDRVGRRAALSISVLMMGIGTLAIGLLPPFEAIGMAAPVLLILARILQGISIGGEFTGGMVFALEHTKHKNRPFVGALVLAGAMCGSTLGLFVKSICSLNNMPSWSWRVAFVIGFFISALGFYIRTHTMETPEFNNIKASEIRKFPFIDGVKLFYKQMFFAIMIAGFGNCLYLCHLVYLPKYLTTLNIAISENFINASFTFCIFINLLMTPMFGLLANKINKAKLMSVAISILFVFVFLLYYNVQALTPWTLILCQIIYATFNAMFCGSVESFLVDSFPVQAVRCSSYSFSNSMGTIFGGFTPMIAVLLTSKAGGNILLGSYICSWGLMALIGIYYLNNLNMANFTINKTNKLSNNLAFTN